MLKAGVKKEEAEELQKKLEAGAMACRLQPLSCRPQYAHMVRYASAVYAGAQGHTDVPLF